MAVDSGQREILRYLPLSERPLLAPTKAQPTKPDFLMASPAAPPSTVPSPKEEAENQIYRALSSNGAQKLSIHLIHDQPLLCRLGDAPQEMNMWIFKKEVRPGLHYILHDPATDSWVLGAYRLNGKVRSLQGLNTQLKEFHIQVLSADPLWPAPPISVRKSRAKSKFPVAAKSVQRAA